jgi:predicted nucleic acid-binding protein
MACLNKEREAPRVIKLFDRATAGSAEVTSIYMSTVNMVEVYYGMIQQKGSVSEADKIMHSVSELPIHLVDTITDDVYREASRLKAAYSISLADAFACATAMSLDATLVTKDHEIEEVEQNEKLSVFWIDKN